MIFMQGEIFLKNALGKVRKMFCGFLENESGEVNIVATVVLIGIAVLLAVIFKDGITKLLKTMLDTITGTANNVVTQQ